MKDKARFILILIVGLSLAGLVSRDGRVLALALPFLVYLAVGIYLCPTKIELLAQRSPAKNETPALAPTWMQVTIENTGSALANLHLDDSEFPHLDLIDGCMSQHLALPVNGKSVMSYTFRARRGLYRWTTLKASAGDPFGLFEITCQVPAQAELLVPTQQVSLRHIPLRPVLTQHTTGSFPARLAGPGTDFWGVREYLPGDPLRWLSWHRSARYPGKYFTKEFEREEIAMVGLVLDARMQADYHASGESLFEYSVRATASLAEHLLKGGNQVGLLIFGKTMSTLFPVYGKRQLYHLRRMLARAAPDSSLSLSYLQHIPARLFPKQAVLVVVSPLDTRDIPVYQSLRASGYQVIVISPDPVEFARCAFPQAEVNDLSSRAARIERSVLIQQLTRGGVQVVSWRVDRPLSEAINMSLSRVRKEPYLGG